MGYAQCICQICTCGRHRCPHNRETQVNPRKEFQNTECRLSEYKEAYRGGPFQPVRKSIRPTQQEPMDQKKRDINSTYVMDYISYKVKPRAIPPKKKYKPKYVEAMDMSTTYGSDFDRKRGERVMPVKPKSDIHQSRNWESTKDCKTINQTTYIKFDSDAQKKSRSSPVRPKENMNRPKEAFNATSTVQADFVEHLGAVRRQPILLKDNTSRATGKFYGTTTYMQEYTAKKNKGIEVRPRSEYKPNVHPFKGETTVMADFKPHFNHKPASSLKPKRVYAPPSAPFDGRTIKSIVHCAWPVVKPEKPAWGKRPEYVPPTIAFAKSSSYMNDYKDIPDYERVSLIEPGNGKPRNFTFLDDKEYKFKGATTYTEDFIRYNGADKSKSFKKILVYKKPTGSLEVDSTMRSEYQGAYVPPAEMCRPKIRSPEARQPMSFETTYELQYTGEQNQECPAIVIDKCSTLKHSFNKNGHKFYASEKKGAKDCCETEKTGCCKEGSGENGGSTASDDTGASKIAKETIQCKKKCTRAEKTGCCQK